MSSELSSGTLVAFIVQVCLCVQYLIFLCDSSNQRGALSSVGIRLEIAFDCLIQTRTIRLFSLKLVEEYHSYVIPKAEKI